MAQNFNTNTDNEEQWLTPPYIIRALGDFDLDPCAPVKSPWPMALEHYTKEDDGLSQPWFGRVWCNPPYGKETFKWLEKLADHGNGIALIFCRTETKGFHAQIFQRAHSIFFFEGRLRFYLVDGTQGGTANAPSCLVSYSFEDTETIVKAFYNGDIKGRLVYLK